MIESTRPARAMGSHHSARADTTTWLTPPHITNALGAFDLDPCAAPSPRPWPTAARHIELPEDGLAADWDGRVWLNPPYSFAAWKWLAKLAEHGRGTALVFARTETAGFVSEVLGEGHRSPVHPRSSVLPPPRRDARRGELGGTVCPCRLRERGRRRAPRQRDRRDVHPTSRDPKGHSMTESTREPLNLDAIQARRDAITPGPWVRRDHEVEFHADIVAGTFATAQVFIEEDAEFIAHAPDDMDALLVEVRRLTEERDQAAAVVEAAPHGFSLHKSDFCGEASGQACDCWKSRSPADVRAVHDRRQRARAFLLGRADQEESPNG